MKHRQLVIVALAASGVLAFVQVGLAAEVPTATDTAQSAREQSAHAEVCNNCHDGTIVAGPLRTPAEWDDVLLRMKANGAEASPVQFALIRAYLLRNYGHADVNVAPAADLAPVLDLLPEAAEAVVAWRTAHGTIKSLDELKKIPGLDALRIEARKDRIMGVL